MSQFKRNINLVLKASKNVNIREKVPEITPNNLKGVLHKDFSIELVEEWDGDNHTEDGITSDKWYKDRNGDFYWSGGFEENEALIQNNEIQPYSNSVLPWWISSYNIQNIWNEGFMGEGIRIAVLDTGIDKKHSNLSNSISKIHNRNFLTLSEDIDDINGHGTHCAGIITSNGLNNVWGIAPKATIYIGKVIRSNKSGINVDVLADAISYYSDKVDIISISLGVPNTSTVLDSAIIKCKNSILVAAVGNDLSGTRAVGDHPAENLNVISVGSTDINNAISNSTIKSTNLDICAPGEDIYSTTINGGFKTDSGTSMATPFVAGLLALLKNKFPQKNKTQIISELNLRTKSLTQNGFVFKSLDPNKIP